MKNVNLWFWLLASLFFVVISFITSWQFPFGIEEYREQIKFVSVAALFTTGILILVKGIYYAYFISSESTYNQDEIFENASVFYNKGQYEDAIYLCRKYLREKPSPRVQLLLARCLKQMGDYSESIDIFEELYELFSEDENVMLEYANILKECNRKNDAFNIYYEIILLDPENQEAFMLGKELANELPADSLRVSKFFSFYFKKFHNTDKTINDAPLSDEKMLYHYLIYLQKQKDRNLLFELLNKLQYEKELSEELTLLMGRIYFEMEEYSKACAVFSPLFVDESDVKLLENIIGGKRLKPDKDSLTMAFIDKLERILKKIGLIDYVIPWWVEYLEQHTREIIIYRRLFSRLFEVREFGKLLIMIKKAGEKIPEFRSEIMSWTEKLYKESLLPDSLKYLRDLENQKKLSQIRLEKYEKEFESNKDDAEFLEKYYSELKNSHYYGKAEKIANRLLEQFPEDKSYQIYRLEIHILQANIEKAIVLLGKWKKDPELLEKGLNAAFSFFLQGLGDSMLAEKMLSFCEILGDMERTLSYTEFFLEKFPKDSRLKLEAGEIFLKLGNYEKCAELLQKEKGGTELEENRRSLLVATALAGMRLFNPARGLLSKVDFKTLPIGKLKEYLLTLGNIFYDTGHFEEAKSYFERLIEIDATFGNVKEKIILINEKIKKMKRGENLSPSINARFEEVFEIGRGGMGAVYRAWDTKLRKEVALKVMNENLVSDKKALKRFLTRDGAIARELEHKNIVRVYDVVEEEVPYIVMEFVDGKNLRDLIKAGSRLSWKFYRMIARQLLEALAYAHSRDIIHRDIKPDNIMITSKGVIKIMDFGLARMLDVTTLTEAGESLGTPLYMPPEQLKGEDLDFKADIYSVGVTFYELFTFQLPFPADDIENLLYMIFKEMPKKLTEVEPSIPDELSEAVLKSLNKKRSERYDSADQFLKALLKTMPKK